MIRAIGWPKENIIHVENGLGGDYTSIGTKYYAAPEQFPAPGQSDAGYDSRVDIYSLGLTLYELANQNHLPFCEPGKSNKEEAVRQRLSGRELPPPSQAHELTEIILKACAFCPENRFQTAEEFLDALEKLELDPYATMPVASFIQKDSLTAQKAEDVPISKSRIDATPTPKPQPAQKNPQSMSKVRQVPSAFRTCIHNRRPYIQFMGLKSCKFQHSHDSHTEAS